MLVKNRIIQGGNRNLEHAGEKAESALLEKIAKRWLSPLRGNIRRKLEQRQYAYPRRRIVFEEYLDPVDYELQLFLFNGQCRFAMVFHRDFYHYGGQLHRLYDEHWNRLPPGQDEFANFYNNDPQETPRPPQEIMQKLHQLCEQIGHVRADFYVSEGEYYFSEFTFTHNGGSPGLIGKYDSELGRFWLR